MTVPDVPLENPAPPPQPMQPRHRLLLAVVTIAAAAFVASAIAAGLGYQTDRRLEAACGSILTVVNPEGASFDRLSSDVNSSKGVVRMLYGINRLGENSARRSVIVCTFGSGTVLASINPELIAASVDGKTIGPARIAFLNRFWLGKGAASG